MEPGGSGSVRIFRTPNQLALALSSQSSSEREAAENAMREIQHVRNSYWYWFESEEYFHDRRPDLLLIGRQENLDADFQRLKIRLGLPPRLSLPSDDISAHRNPRDLDTHLDEQAVRNLKEWYHADYRFLELCRPFFGE